MSKSPCSGGGLPSGNPIGLAVVKMASGRVIVPRWGTSSLLGEPQPLSLLNGGGPRGKTLMERRDVLHSLVAFPGGPVSFALRLARFKDKRYHFG